MWTNPQVTADLFTFTIRILIFAKIYFHGCKFSDCQVVVKQKKKKEKNGSIFTKKKCQKMTNLAKKWQKWCFYEQFYKSKTSKGRWPNNTIVPLIKLHLFINSNVNDIDSQIEQCYKLISTMYQIYDSRTNNSKNNWPKISCEKPCKNCIKLQRTKA